MSGGARVTVLPDPESGPATATGATQSAQEAELIVPLDVFRELWHAEYLERLARAYWLYLGKISLGLIKVVYEPDARTVVLLTRRLPLLRFRKPEYITGAGFGRVTWRIERGLLVSPAGRGQGYLQITVRSEEPREGDQNVTVSVRAAVANFYPFIRGGGWFARIGARIYNVTQLRIHRRITHGFLKSLARLDLPPSQVGSLAAEETG